jgi:hypothetical protein
MSDTKMQCKVKIGSAYEPKWFERRQTNGWYSGRNPPLDQDAMNLQSVMLGTSMLKERTSMAFKVSITITVLSLAIWVAGVYLF